jgi:hypothetical protein
MPASLLRLFAVPVHVKRLEGAEMPKEHLGAYLVCYVSAADHQRALELAIETLRQDHYQFLEMNGEISELDPAYWGKYVQATWAEDGNDLLEQSEIQAFLVKEDAFYGPFCCYDNDD